MAHELHEYELDRLSPDIFINEADGLSNHHPSLPEDNDFDDDDYELDWFEDLPNSVIVTNIHSEVFENEELMCKMETLFKIFSENATFQWLKSFRRLRVNFDSGIEAANARIQLHLYPFGKSVITCFFAQPGTPVAEHNRLKPPAPFKQFLISPPASPPAGWEPREEGEPLVNHDLLAALASLTPGECHELHPPVNAYPSIILETAEAVPAPQTDVKCKTIPHTKCPERSSS